MNTIDLLLGKNILIFDLETTWLPTKKNKYVTGIDQYYDPIDVSKYDSCRIVSIAHTYIENFNFYSLNNAKIKHYLRKQIDFKEINNSDLHGITYENTKLNGKFFHI